MSPTSLTLKHLREAGFMAAPVEKRVPGRPDVTMDLFGFADVLAVHPRDSIFLLVQATSDNGGNVSARVKKVMANANARCWLKAKGLVEVHGWRRDGRLRRVKIVLEACPAYTVKQAKRRKGVARQKTLFERN